MFPELFFLVEVDNFIKYPLTKIEKIQLTYCIKWCSVVQQTIHGVGLALKTLVILSR